MHWKNDEGTKIVTMYETRTTGGLHLLLICYTTKKLFFEWHADSLKWDGLMYYDYDEHQEDKIPHILNIRLKLWLCIFLNPAFMIMVRLPRLNLLSQAPFLFATPSSPPCSLLLLKTDFHVSITAPNGHERARAQNGKCGVLVRKHEDGDSNK